MCSEHIYTRTKIQQNSYVIVPVNLYRSNLLTKH